MLGNFNKYIFWPFMNSLLRILSSNIHNKQKIGHSANHRDETTQKICISMPSRRDMFRIVFFFILSFWGHSMISFVNLIRRRSFFVITANHYSVGRLNKQANKIINEESEKRSSKERKKRPRIKKKQSRGEPTATRAVCCAHKRRCKLLLFIETNCIKEERENRPPEICCGFFFYDRSPLPVYFGWIKSHPMWIYT